MGRWCCCLPLVIRPARCRCWSAGPAGRRCCSPGTSPTERKSSSPASFPVWATGGGSRPARARSWLWLSSSPAWSSCPLMTQQPPSGYWTVKRCAVNTASETSVVSDGDQVTSDVLLLGASGNRGRLIAAEVAARGLSVRLAGRRRGPLEDLARALAADGATTDVRAVDVSDAASLAGAIAGTGAVLSTIGPFARQAGPVIDACLAAGLPYVDIANEWPAVRGLLDRDAQARAHA